MQHEAIASANKCENLALAIPENIETFPLIANAHCSQVSDTLRKQRTISRPV